MNNWKDGLPGVGVECEVWAHSDTWIEGLSIYHDTIDGDVKVAVVKIHHDTYMPFSAKCVRPIKKREPTPGEVFESPCGTALVISDYGAVCLSDGAYLTPQDMADKNRIFTYAAPDVKSYIARELLDEGNLMSVFDHLNLLTKAARLDED